MIQKTDKLRSMVFGVFRGMKTVRARPKAMPDDPIVASHPTFYSAGYVIGTILQLVILILVVRFGL